MTGRLDIFRPNGLKLILAVTLIVPVLFITMLVTGFPYYDEMLLPAVIAIIISYLAACLIDQTIQSRIVKIAIASIAALVSIILGSIIIRSMTMVCDPVHDPGLVCDPVHEPEPSVVTTAATMRPTVITTPMIFDPVHEPNGCGPECGVAPGIVTGIVAQKLDECKRNCNR